MSKEVLSPWVRVVRAKGCAELRHPIRIVDEGVVTRARVGKWRECTVAEVKRWLDYAPREFSWPRTCPWAYDDVEVRIEARGNGDWQGSRVVGDR